MFSADSAAPTGLYTVAVRPEDSARLLLLVHEYDVYLTLLGPHTDPSNIAPVADKDALPAITTTTIPTGTPTSTP